MEETRIVGDLPNVRIELTHRAEPDGSAEHMVINLTATPDFRSALPLLGNVNALFQPLALWQAMMAPWMALASSNPMAAFLLPSDESAKK